MKIEDTTTVEEQPEVTDPPDDEVEDDDPELLEQVTTDAQGRKMVPLSALVKNKREAKALKKRVGELEPVAAKTNDVEDRLNRVMPVINAIVSDPALYAAAQRAAAGTRPTGERVEQPREDDDPEAKEIAEALNLYTSAGDLDLVRARKSLAIIDRRAGRSTAEAVKPFAGMALGQRAEANLTRAVQSTDDDGNPWATPESIREVAGMLDQRLLADPSVVELVLNSAIGLDRRKGRTPKAQEAPMFLERPRGGGRNDAVISSEEKRLFTRVGLNDKDVNAVLDKLDKTAPGKGVRLE